MAKEPSRADQNHYKVAGKSPRPNQHELENQKKSMNQPPKAKQPQVPPEPPANRRASEQAEQDEKADE